VAFAFLKPDNIFSRYDTAKKYTEQLTEPFDEFQRIARNRPYDGIDPAYPKTTDGTTASIIRKTPRRVIQQLPTGVIETDDDDAWLPIVAQFVYTHKILPFANEDYDLITKCWGVTEKGLTFGSAGTFCPFLNHDGYFCPDMTDIYWGDLFLQPGKKSGYACNYLFVRAWWQKEDLESLIDSQKDVKDSSWDVESLREILTALIEKEAKAKAPHETERGGENTGIELVTGFQKGLGAKFYTFNPDKKKVVRTKTNKDPRGKIPIDFMYGDTDGNNPLGRGIVELVGGLQNLIDSDMQMYQYNRALMLAPPLVKYGNIANSQVKMVPNAVIDASTDPNAKIVPLSIDTTAVANYPQLYQLQQSQLFNLVQSPQSTNSSTDAALGQGKTPAALNQQKATISVDDNYVRKMFESWFENWSETAVNLYFAERSGKEELQLDDDTADQLRKLAAEGKFDESLLSPDNKILIDYDTATPALKFRVDASTSKMKDDSEQLEALSNLMSAIEAIPAFQQLIMQFPDKIVGAYNSFVSNSGVEDPEKLSISEDELAEMKQQQEMAAQAQQQQQAMDAQQQMAQQPQPDQGMPSEQPPEEAMPPSPHDAQIVQHLRALGFDDSTASQAIDMLNQGATDQQVMQALGVGA
jgi:hypothetical protein